MRPEEKRPNKFQTGKARARMLLKKNAGWLPGFPLKVDEGSVQWKAWPWERPGAAWTVTLDRDALRRVEMVLNKLRHRFPNALPKIVEDADDWLARMDFLLELLKGAIHGGQSIEAESLLTAPCANTRWGDAFRWRRSRYPDLAPLLDAVAFAQFTGRSCCHTPVLDWIDEHAPRLLRLAPGGWELRDVQLSLCTLREDIHAGFLPVLLAVQGESAAYSIPAEEIGKHAEKLHDELKKALNGTSFVIPDKQPSPTMGECWQEFVQRLLAMNSKARRNATALLGSLLPRNIPAVTRGLKDQMEKEEARLGRLLHRIQHSEWLLQSKTESKKIKKANAVKLDDSLLQFLDHTRFALTHVPAIAEDASRCRQWIRLAECLSDNDRFLRLGLFAKWEREQLQCFRPTSASHTFRHVLSELCRLLARRGVHPCLLRHWRKYIVPRNRHRDDVVSCLLNPASYPDGYGREMSRRWGRLLESTVYDHDVPLGTELLISLDNFVSATDDVNLAARLVVALADREDDYYTEDAIRATLAIASEDANFAAIMESLDNDYELLEAAAVLGEHLRDDRLRRIVEQWVITGSKKPLLRLASCTRAVIGLGSAAPTADEIQEASDWLHRYPAELHAALRDLQKSGPEAEAVAAGILSRDFPDPGNLRRELDTIRHKLAAEHTCLSTLGRLQKRMENLQKRLDRPPTVTPKRLDNLATKIRERADHETIERYVGDCHTVVKEKLWATWGVQQSLEDVLAPPRDELLTGILQLKGTMKQLGLKLFFESLRDPQLDFRNESENARFLAELRAQGTQLEPWLGGSFERTAKTAGGEPYRLFFARDVLDILLMGSRFDTCLSPGSMNFFSSIANAVDVNKQVVYGKTESGRVVGRCLFVLADNGAILTYHRYAHEGADRFDEEVNRFAEELARKMNTVLTTSGQVSRLVAQRWYDDGAVSSASIYDLQNPDGAVRTILRTGAPSTLCEQLADFLGSENALRSLLGSLLVLDEFRQRKEIVVPLLDRLGFDTSIPFAERYRLAVLGKAAGCDDTAREIIHQMRVTSVPRRLRHYACRHCSSFHELGSCTEVIGLLLECNPSIALRTLRHTRPEGIKSDEQETDPERKEMLERCHRLLGRAG